MLEDYKQARINRDSNFDGRFYFAVKTTGIFCRPSCPSPAAKEENVVYFESMFDAMKEGFRPCHRCRPDIETEYVKSYISGSQIVDNALQLIYEGFLNYHSLTELADNLFVSERHMRKLFTDNLRLSPVKIAKYHKSVFAGKLIKNSALPVTEIAFASGFGSVRQFNDIYKEVFGETPSESRKKRNKLRQDKTVFLLPYRKPFDFEQLLSFMKMRTIVGVEIVCGNEYSRTFRTAFSSGYFTVRDISSKSCLELKIISDDIRSYMELYYRVRSMFDLDTDFSRINEKFINDEVLASGMKNGQVPRLPAAFDVFEFIIRSVLGQQISVKAATTLAARIAETGNVRTNENFPDGLNFFFPTPAEFQNIDLGSIGITSSRQETLKDVTENILNGKLKLVKNQSFKKFYNDITSVKGIGDWTANYAAMRGLGMIDAFPSSDLGIIKALSFSGIRPSQKQIKAISDKWQPYRAYAAMCLWNRI